MICTKTFEQYRCPGCITPDLNYLKDVLRSPMCREERKLYLQVSDSAVVLSAQPCTCKCGTRVHVQLCYTCARATVIHVCTCNCGTRVYCSCVTRVHVQLCYTCARATVVHVCTCNCGARVHVQLWCTCVRAAVVHVCTCNCDTHVHVQLWCTCNCVTRVHVQLWYTCARATVVHVQLWYTCRAAREQRRSSALIGTAGTCPSVEKHSPIRIIFSKFSFLFPLSVQFLSLLSFFIREYIFV